MKTRVLFLCIHNSARSQMAEALFNKLGDDRFEAESAGIEPGPMNPLAIAVMKEMGIDISQNKSKEVFDLYKEGKMFHYVIAVCDEAINEKCPIFPGMMKRLSWPFPNPVYFIGTEEEKLQRTREVRDQINDRILKFVESLSKETV
jgi:arsenate reductase